MRGKNKAICLLVSFFLASIVIFAFIATMPTNEEIFRKNFEGIDFPKNSSEVLAIAPLVKDRLESEMVKIEKYQSDFQSALQKVRLILPNSRENITRRVKMFEELEKMRLGYEILWDNFEQMAGAAYSAGFIKQVEKYHYHGGSLWWIRDSLHYPTE